MFSNRWKNCDLMEAMEIRRSCAIVTGLGSLKFSSRPSLLYQTRFHPRVHFSSPFVSTTKLRTSNHLPMVLSCSNSSTPTTLSSEAEDIRDEGSGAPATTYGSPPLRMIRTRRRYRKQYPGEKEGITEEMRFVAMKLRNVNYKIKASEVIGNGESGDKESVSEDDGGGGEGVDTWHPSVEGFLSFLVDSNIVFSTVERIVDESSDVSYAYFRKTGLERSEGLSKDLEWFSQRDVLIPAPSNTGVMYAKYLEELAEKSPPLFLSHFYNIYFCHIAGGQVIARKVSDKVLDGRELEFYKWKEDPEKLMRGVREKLNLLGEHWPRDERNKCLREATKCFRFLGQIVRLIIL